MVAKKAWSLLKLSPKKVAALTGLLAVVALLVAGVFYVGVWVPLKEATEALSKVEARVEGGGSLRDADTLDFIEVQLLLAEERLRAAHRTVSAFSGLYPLAGWVPGYGDDIRALPRLAEMGLKGVQGGLLGFQAASPLLEVVLQEEFTPLQGKSVNPLLLDVVDQAHKYLLGAQQALEEASEARAGVDTLALLPRAAGLVERFDRRVPQGKALVRVALDLVETVGAGEGVLRALPPSSSMEPSLFAVAGVDSVEKAREVDSTLLTLAGALGNLERDLAFLAQYDALYRRLPGVGALGGGETGLVTAMTDVVEGAHQALQGSLPVLTLAAKPGFVLLRGNAFDLRVLDALRRGKPELSMARDRLRRAKEVLVKLGPAVEHPLLVPYLVRMEREVGDLSSLVEEALGAIEVLPIVWGMDGPRTFLLIAQNPDELRATGGFIPGAWLLRMNRGRIEELRFMEVGDVDDLSRLAEYPPAPEPVLKYMRGARWMFRDSNWDPNFPASARLAENLFQLGSSQKVDGVISMSWWGLMNLIEPLLPMSLPLGGVIETKEGFIQVLEKNSDSVGERYMDVVLQSLLNRIGERLPQDRLMLFVQAARESLREKDTLLYFNGEVEEALKVAGWDGALAEAKGDYLMVVDSNIGWNKVNRSIRQRLGYQVFLSDSGARGQATITYRNLSKGGAGACLQWPGWPNFGPYNDLKNDCLWDYLRVYVPRGSDLLGADQFPLPQGSVRVVAGEGRVGESTLEIYGRGDKAVFGGFFVVDRGEEKVATFSYELPQGVFHREGLEARYNLYLQKQPGTRDVVAEVTVFYPQAYVLRKALPEPTTVEPGVARFSFVLDTDKEVDMSFELGLSQVAR